MFTGIVEEIGRVTAVDESDGGRRFRIHAPRVSEDLEIGASVSVEGACLTATSVRSDSFSVDLVAETLARTTLGTVSTGTGVNLERAMPASGRFDGHIVQGHVDDVGQVVRLDDGPDGVRLDVECPPALRRFVVEKGSITVNGVSLTVASVDDSGFGVALIPHTSEMTTLGRLTGGDPVNLEVDILAKYIERLMESRV